MVGSLWLVEGTTPLTLVLATIPLLLRAQNSPKTWNRALQTLARVDSFYAGTTISICRLDLDEGSREVLGSCGPDSHELRKETLRSADIRMLSVRLLSRLRNGAPLVVNDHRVPPPGLAGILKGLLPPSLKQPFSIVPLVSSDRIAGAFWVEGYDPSLYSTERMQILQVLGWYLSFALVAEKCERGERERNSVLEVALEAQERERERIALDLHDGPVQILASAFQHVQAAKDGRHYDDDGTIPALSKASGLLREAMHELRGLMYSLRPPTLDHFGLLASIEADLQELRQAGWQAELVSDNIEVSKDRETSLYRIIGEAITNVRKHAGTCRIKVSLRTRKLFIHVGVRDWGRGFALASLSSRQGTQQSFGLLSMRKRAELLGGRFEIESEVGEGTDIRLRIPIKKREDRMTWRT